MRKFYSVFIIMSMVLTSCAKEVLQPIVIDFGKKTVGVDAGSFPVRVSTDCAWYAQAESSWIKVDSEFHESEGTVLVNYDSNASSEGDWRFNRIGYVYIKTYDGGTVGKIAVWQKGIAPAISFPQDNIIPAAGGACRVECMTNLTDSERSRIKISTEAAWITGLEWSRDGRSVKFTAQAGSQRQAEITLRHTDAWGIVTERKFNVIQEG